MVLSPENSVSSLIRLISCIFFSSLFGLDLVLGLGASNEAKDAGKRTLGILKSRMGPDSVQVKLIGDLPGHSLTFRFREAVAEDEEAELLTEKK